MLTQETLCSPPFLQAQHEKGVEVVVGKSRRTDAQELVLGLSRASCSLQSCSHQHGTAVPLGTLQPSLPRASSRLWHTTHSLQQLRGSPSLHWGTEGSRNTGFRDLGEVPSNPDCSW